MNPNDISIQKFFSTVDDPRKYHIRHKLLDIITIAICAIICGADSWVMVEEYGKSKYEWLKKFLELPEGIPSHDTFGRVFAAIDPKQFNASFSRWSRSISTLINTSHVAIDGKTVRRSHDNAQDKSAIHMLSAWAVENGIVLGQVKTDEKSNEITAIPELIKHLELEKTVVTIDAMGCQKSITKEIIDKKADYVLALKGNHSNLHNQIELFFRNRTHDNLQNDPSFTSFQSTDGDHGRVELRRYWSTSDIDWLQGKEQWHQLKTVAMVQRERHIGDKASRETAFYISSLDNDARQIATAIRRHWHIENRLHWVLDVTFREDLCRVRKKNAPENLASLRHIALNMLKQEKSFKGSIQTKRFKAALESDYLVKILTS